LHDKCRRGRINYLHQLAYFLLILSASFEECNSILSYFFKVVMEVIKEHIRHILLYEFNKGNNAMENAENIKAEYGDRTISQCQRFQKFRTGNYSLEDEHRL